MSIATIGNAGSATSAGNPSAKIGIEDFLRILTTQLNYQDPLKPMDNTEFVAQLAQFTSLQENQQTNDKLDNLLTIQSATQSVGLIGRTVDVSASGGKQTGQVAGLDFSSGTPQLTITISGGQQLTGVSLANISNVR